MDSILGAWDQLVMPFLGQRISYLRKVKSSSQTISILYDIPNNFDQNIVFNWVLDSSYVN